MTTITLPPLPEAASPEWPFSAADEAIIRADRLAVAQAVIEACSGVCSELAVDAYKGSGSPHEIAAMNECADAIRAIQIEVNDANV